MEQIKYIRKLCINKGLPKNTVAKMTGHHWSTVDKYVEKDNWNEPEPKVKERKSKLDKVKPIIDKWLQDDLREPPKQRHTAKRVYDRLRDEHSDIFNASERAIRAYVAKRKKELYEKNDGFIPLDHPPGEAQADFGKVVFIERGLKQEGFYLNLSFPYSNASYFQVFKGENLECLLTGLKTIFEYMECVPIKIWFDNLSPVVKEIRKNGERKLTDRFEKFSMHYGFQHNFCNPNSGHEKGHVEGKVGYNRRNYFVPIPQFNDLSEYNKQLFHKADKDMNRKHYKKYEYIYALFERDKLSMRKLPENCFEVFRLEKAKADLYGKVKVDGRYTYSVSPTYARQEIWLKITHDKVHMLNESYRTIITHDRMYGSQTESMNWLPYLELMAKRPNALKYTTFYSMLPHALQEYFDDCRPEDKKSGLKVLSKILNESPMDIAEKVFEETDTKGFRDEESLMATYYRVTKGVLEFEDMNLADSVPELKAYSTNISVYDNFLKGSEF